VTCTSRSAAINLAARHERDFFQHLGRRSSADLLDRKRL